VEQGSQLVDMAGSTMNEVVDSIRRVTDIMGEISAASTEQANGVAGVGQAVSEMDQATQQNAALVEEMAAAAASLNAQAQELAQTVAVFKGGQTGGFGGRAAPASYTANPRPAAPRVAPKPLPKPAPKPLSKPAANPAALGRKPAPSKPNAPKLTAAAPAAKPADDEWETF
jgi:methyl-accepting chemotaxis protein